MLKLHPLASLSLLSGIVFTSWACSSGGVADTEIVKVPTGGSDSTTAGASNTGGSGSVGGSGSPVDTAGSTATAGTDSGQAGSQASGGTGGGMAAGGSGGVPAGGSGGSTAGGSSGGSGGSGGSSEEGKIVLFDGSAETFKSWKSRNNNQDNPWTNNGDGTMTVKGGTGDIITKMGFQNVFVHVEYRSPKFDVAPADPQQRGNSGVYLKGSYEVQVLDTFGLQAKDDYCGAIYKIAAPIKVACKMAGEWNSYDIEFKANTCANGTKNGNASFVEVKLNNEIIHQNQTADRTTQGGLAESCNPAGLLLQDHGTIVPVSFRNIWAIPRN